MIFRKLFRRKANIDISEDDGSGMSDGGAGDSLYKEGSHYYMDGQTAPERWAGTGSGDCAYEAVEIEILPVKIICPDCGGITLEGLDFCDKCGGELQ